MNYIYWKNKEKAKLIKNREIVYYLLFDLSGIQKYIFQDYFEKDALVIQKRSQQIDDFLQQIHHMLQNTFQEKYLNVSYFGGSLEAILKKDISVDQLETLLNQMKNSILYLTEFQLIPLYEYKSCYFFYSNQKINETIIKLKKLKPIHHELYRTIELKKYHYDYNEIKKENILALTKSNNNICIHNIQHGVAIKCDLDNLGVFFQSIRCVDEKKEISLNIQNIINKVCSNIDANTIISSGDDIFVITQYQNVYYVAYQIYFQLKDYLKNDDLLNNYHFSLSLGASSYYNLKDFRLSFMKLYEMSEEQLDYAKLDGKNCMYFDNIKFTWEKINQIQDCLKKFSQDDINTIGILSREDILEYLLLNK